jgi:hypothetical protein
MDLTMKLTSKDREKMPRSEFALPGKRAYPIPDKSHAANAKARASEMEHNGRISKGAEEKIDRKADRVLGNGGPRFGGHANVRNPKTHAMKLKHC